MKTRHSDNIIITQELDEMKGKYLAERLLRSWNEEFVDEDTGEMVTIKRHEILLDKGTFIDGDNLSQINFYLQSKDIESVKVSEIQRTGAAAKTHLSLFMVTVQNGKKKYNFFLYADSIESAILIATDYLEQKLIGWFQFTSIKELNFCTLIPESKEEPTNEEEKEFYSVEIEVTVDDFKNYQSFILRAANAEDAKDHAEKNIISTLKKNGEYHEDETIVETALISAKKISCENIIDLNFSKPYLKEE